MIASRMAVLVVARRSGSGGGEESTALGGEVEATSSLSVERRKREVIASW